MPDEDGAQGPPFAIAVQVLDEGFVVLDFGNQRAYAVSDVKRLGRRVQEVAEEVAKTATNQVQSGGNVGGLIVQMAQTDIQHASRRNPTTVLPPPPPPATPVSAEALAAQHRNLDTISDAFAKEQITLQEWQDYGERFCFAIPSVERELRRGEVVAEVREQSGDDDDEWEDV